MAINLRNLKNFKQGVKDLSPEQQLNVTIASSVGGMVGLTIAFISMVISLFLSFDWKVFGFTIFVFFMIPLQYIQYARARKQKDGAELDNNIIDAIKARMDEKQKTDRG